MRWSRMLVSMLLIGLLLSTQIQCSGGSEEPPQAASNTTGSPAAPSDAIARENALPGTSAWRMSTAPLNGEITAFADQESYAAGSEVRMFVSAQPAGTFRWEVFRMGGYRGLGGRLYLQGGPIVAPRQPDASFEPSTGLVEAGWAPTFTILTRHSDGTAWLTGIYLVLLTKEDGWQTYVLFILRDDTRDAEIAVQIATATWHAYNSFGGESCYESAHGLPGGAAVKVSLNRPMVLGHGSGTFLWVQHGMVGWMEDQGYDIEYLSSIDIGGITNRLGRHRLYISLGHEEYTTMAALDRLEAAIGAGTSLAFLSGDTMVWQVRYEDNERTVVCYKHRADEDPMRFINPRLVSTRFRDPPVSRPENQLTGVMSDGSHIDEPADWVVTNADHWFYANTGLANGSRIPDLVFNEWDGVVDNGLNPPGLVVLASSVVPNTIRPASRHEATIYERGQAFVFAAGSIYFSLHVQNQPVVMQMMVNLLARVRATIHSAGS